VPDIVSEAARRVRAANSIGAAQAVLRVAIGEARASIALLRAEDPDVRDIGPGSRDWLSGTLEVANLALLRATEL
jgi:regulator of protease activity HflC (stomatin/prohibitin superfamily)